MQYHFVTHWHVDAPIEDVFDAIFQAERWPSWWKGVEQVTELRKGDERGIGGCGRYVWKSLLPYRLTFEVTSTRVERPHLLEGRAEGELAGTGRWDVREAPSGGTDVTYFWDVCATRRWMNALGPLAKPVFQWNHNYVMRDGERGLARLLAGSVRPTTAVPNPRS